MTTIEVLPDGMKITMSEPARQAVINHALGMFVEARAFALQCVDILVDEHGARRDGIQIDHFYHRRIGQQVGAALDGKTMDTPRQMVAHALQILWPWVVGLGKPTTEQQAKIDAGWVEVIGENV